MEWSRSSTLEKHLSSLDSVSNTIWGISSVVCWHNAGALLGQQPNSEPALCLLHSLLLVTLRSHTSQSITLISCDSVSRKKYSCRLVRHDTLCLLLFFFCLFTHAVFEQCGDPLAPQLNICLCKQIDSRKQSSNKHLAASGSVYYHKPPYQ